MKKIVLFSLLLISILSFTVLGGCGKNDVLSAEPAVIADFIQTQASFEDMSELTQEQILLRYSVDFDYLESATVLVSNADSCSEEIAVFKVKDVKNIDNVLSAVGERKAQKLSSFKNLNATEYKKIENAFCETKDNYVLFVVSKDFSDEIF